MPPMKRGRALRQIDKQLKQNRQAIRDGEAVLRMVHDGNHPLDAMHAEEIAAATRHIQRTLRQGVADLERLRAIVTAMPSHSMVDTGELPEEGDA